MTVLNKYSVADPTMATKEEVKNLVALPFFVATIKKKDKLFNF
jgi:hypothetical protein